MHIPHLYLTCILDHLYLTSMLTSLENSRNYREFSRASRCYKEPPRISKSKPFFFLAPYYKHVLSLCKLGKCPNPLFYRCKFLPRLNRDCIFDFCYKSRMKMRASEGTWGLPSSPIVRKKHVLSLCKLAKCKNHLWLQ